MEERSGKAALCYCCLVGCDGRVVWYKCIEISERLTTSIKTFTLLKKAAGYSETSTPLHQNKRCRDYEDSINLNHHWENLKCHSDYINFTLCQFTYNFTSGSTLNMNLEFVQIYQQGKGYRRGPPHCSDPVKLLASAFT